MLEEFVAPSFAEDEQVSSALNATTPEIPIAKGRKGEIH
jgi:hypothetical protein